MKIKYNMDNNSPDTGREWLESNGKGGYCSSSLSLCNTRKYHGLLVHPAPGLEGRFVFLSGMEIIVNDGKNSYELSNRQYPGSIHPEGYRYLVKYEKNLFPEWTCKAGDAVILVSVFMTDDDAVYILAENRSGKKCPAVQISFRPVFAFRNSHTLTRRNPDLDPAVTREKNTFRFEPYKGICPVFMTFSMDSVFTEKNFWLENIEYSREMERGFDFKEDCFVPGEFSFTLNNMEKVFSRTGLSISAADFEKTYGDEKKKREKEKTLWKGEPEVLRLLKKESRHFFIRNRDENLSILAGYPWFGEWGRDTMISLPGLTICRGESRKGMEILLSYAGYLKNGLLPNTLGGTQGFESYNSIDAALLYIWAAQQLWIYGNMKKSIREDLFPVISSMIEAYLDGRVPGLTISPAGFPEAGDEGSQLTWMDAKSRGVPVTPRHGSPVEITALFYNGLRFYMELCDACRSMPDSRAAEAAGKIEENFINAYWIEEGGYLADVVRNDYKDASVRPNMLWAAAVPYPLVDTLKAGMILDKTEKELLTPFGLRTLSPSSPGFKGLYAGDGEERDSIYHQGTVWPWLLGIYTDTALYSARDKIKKSMELEAYLLSLLEKHIYNEGIGFVSEIFDGSRPNEGKGSFAQAWSSAEIIRSLYKIKEVVK